MPRDCRHSCLASDTQIDGTGVASREVRREVWERRRWIEPAGLKISHRKPFDTHLELIGLVGIAVIGNQRCSEHELERLVSRIEGPIRHRLHVQFTHPQQTCRQYLNACLLSDLTDHGVVEGFTRSLSAAGKDEPIRALVVGRPILGDQDSTINDHDGLGGRPDPSLRFAHRPRQWGRRFSRKA
jgi:hypothetical protein